jgi:hypothetical protein
MMRPPVSLAIRKLRIIVEGTDMGALVRIRPAPARAPERWPRGVGGRRPANTLTKDA